MAAVVFVDLKGSAVRGAAAKMVSDRAPGLIAALSGGQREIFRNRRFLNRFW